MPPLFPIVGQQVEYVPMPSDPGYRDDGAYQTAFVAGLNEDDKTVNLAVFDAFGHLYSAQRVPMQAGATPRIVGYARPVPHRVPAAVKAKSAPAASATPTGKTEEAPDDGDI